MNKDGAEKTLSAGLEHRDGDHTSGGCEMAGLLEMLAKPWTMHILWYLSRQGPMRFGALKRSVEGISARLLTVRLRTLEAEGFVERTVVEGKIPEVTYKPTSRLTDMNKVMQHLSELDAKWRSNDGAGKPSLLHQPASQTGGK